MTGILIRMHSFFSLHPFQKWASHVFGKSDACCIISESCSVLASSPCGKQPEVFCHPSYVINLVYSKVKVMLFGNIRDLNRRDISLD